MVAQNVTHSLPNCYMLVIRVPVSLPPSLAGYYQSEPANVGNEGLGWGFLQRTLTITKCCNRYKNGLVATTVAIGESIFSGSHVPVFLPSAMKWRGVGGEDLNSTTTTSTASFGHIFVDNVSR